METPQLIYVEKDKKSLYNNIELFKQDEEEKERLKKDQFIFAMAFGFKHGRRVPLKTKEWFFRTSSLKEDDEMLIDALALAETKKPEILINKKEVYKIAQEYAKGGIEQLNMELESIPFGSFDKRLEKDLSDYYSDIFKRRPDQPKNSEKSERLFKLLSQGEGEKIEFKSSLRWDIKQKQVNKILEKVIAKSIAGFLNTKGGTLLIGVSDDGSICGIEKDIKSLHRKDLDGFQQSLVNIIENYLGITSMKYLKIKFEEYNEKNVCLIDIDNSPKPVFLTHQSNQEFYIRAGNTTKPLNPQEMLEYVQGA